MKRQTPIHLEDIDRELLAAEAARMQYKGMPAADYVLVEVADTGTGIPAAILPKIFDSFFTSREDGTGLGLAIVKRILRDHRGDIIVESTGPAGTTFKFWFPAQK